MSEWSPKPDEVDEYARAAVSEPVFTADEWVARIDREEEVCRLRLECLILALGVGNEPGEIVVTAGAFAAFVFGETRGEVRVDVNATEQFNAAVGAAAPHCPKGSPDA